MKSLRILGVLGALWLAALFLTGCSSSPQRESKPSADWSRGILLGSFANGSIGLVVDGAGERVHLIFPSDIGEGTYFRYQQLDAQAAPQVTKDLEFPGLLRAPRLAPASDGRLHLLWASRVPGGKIWTIWHVLLDAAGEALVPARQISLPDKTVGSYTVVSDHQGGVWVAWDSGGPGEIYLQHLDASGTPIAALELIASNGESPSLWANSQGELFFAWFEPSQFVYARSQVDAPVPLEITPVVDLTQGTGQSLVGPFIGLSRGWAYLFWSSLNQSGLEAGTGYTAYVSFPADAPSKQAPTRVLMSSDEEQPYALYQGSFALSQLVPPVVSASATSDYILHPSVMLGAEGDQLAVALVLNQMMRLDQHLQIAVALFEAGEFVGYTLGSRTEGISNNPVLFVDSTAHLHLAWREGAAGNGVFYATTQPAAITALDQLNVGDVINAIFQGSMESLVSVAFLPIIGFGWLLPGLLIVGTVKILRDHDDLTRWVYWVPLIIALVIFYLAKFATLPTITTYVPFSAWLDIPPGFAEPLRIGMPPLILAIAGLTANQVRLRYAQSAALFYIVFVLVDAFLSLAIYGVNLLGTY